MSCHAICSRAEFKHGTALKVHAALQWVRTVVFQNMSSKQDGQRLTPQERMVTAQKMVTEQKRGPAGGFASCTPQSVGCGVRVFEKAALLGRKLILQSPIQADHHQKYHKGEWQSSSDRRRLQCNKSPCDQQHAGDNAFCDAPEDPD